MSEATTMRTTTSICWNCKNARATRCAWIDKKEKVWERAVEKQCRLEKERGSITLWAVQKCKKFSPERGWKDKRPVPLPVSKKGGSSKRYTPEEDALILSLRKKGVPCGAIADRMGRSLGAIYQRITRLKEMGMMEVQQDGETACIAAIR